MRNHNVLVGGFAVALLIASADGAQLRRAPTMPADAKVDAAIALRVDGQPYQSDGKASCQHAPVASIYGVPAANWSVQQSDGERSIALTLWRPKNAPGDWFVLNVTRGRKSYVVNTVRAGDSAVQGSGRVTLTPSGSGGTFTIDATAASGASISGTIKCSVFGAAIAEGGN